MAPQALMDSHAPTQARDRFERLAPTEINTASEVHIRASETTEIMSMRAQSQRQITTSEIARGDIPPRNKSQAAIYVVSTGTTAAHRRSGRRSIHAFRTTIGGGPPERGPGRPRRLLSYERYGLASVWFGAGGRAVGASEYS